MASSTLPRGRRGKVSERSRASQMVAMFPCEQYGPLAHYPMLPFHGPVWPYWMSCYTGLAASSDSGGSAGQSVSGGTQEDVFALTNALDDAKEALRDSRSDVRDCQRRLQTALASIEQLGEEVKDLRNYQLRYKLSEEELSDLEFENAMLRQKIRDIYQDHALKLHRQKAMEIFAQLGGKPGALALDPRASLCTLAYAAVAQNRKMGKLLRTLQERAQCQQENHAEQLAEARI